MAAGKTEVTGWKTWAKNVSLGTGRADCNEAPRGPVRAETKDPTRVRRTRRRSANSSVLPLWVSYSEWLCSTLSHWSITPCSSLFWSACHRARGEKKIEFQEAAGPPPPHQSAARRYPTSVFVWADNAQEVPRFWKLLNQRGMLQGTTCDWGVKNNMYIFITIGPPFK